MAKYIGWSEAHIKKDVPWSHIMIRIMSNQAILEKIAEMEQDINIAITGALIHGGEPSIPHWLNNTALNLLREQAEKRGLTHGTQE